MIALPTRAMDFGLRLGRVVHVPRGFFAIRGHESAHAFLLRLRTIQNAKQCACSPRQSARRHVSVPRSSDGVSFTKSRANTAALAYVNPSPDGTLRLTHRRPDLPNGATLEPCGASPSSMWKVARQHHRLRNGLHCRILVPRVRNQSQHKQRMMS